MEQSRSDVCVINISPDNWEACLRDYRFGIRVDARHPKSNKARGRIH